VIPAPDPQRLLAIGGNNARLLDAASGKLVVPYRPHNAVTSAHFSPDGKSIISTGADGDVKLWGAVPNAKEFGRVQTKIPRAHEAEGRALAVNYAAFDSTGQRVVTVGDDHLVKHWQLKGTTAEFTGSAVGHTARVLSAQFSSDDNFLLTASADGTARIWPQYRHPINAANDSPELVVLQHPAAVLFATYDPHDVFVITGCADHLARVWEVEHPEKPRFILSGHTAGVTAAAVAPNGKRLATGSQDGIVKLWDLTTGKEVLSLKRHTAEITAVQFSSDGKNLLTSSSDQTAIIWRAIE
jgi:WD40 repeat protein